MDWVKTCRTGLWREGEILGIGWFFQPEFFFKRVQVFGETKDVTGDHYRFGGLWYPKEKCNASYTSSLFQQLAFKQKERNFNNFKM